MKNNLKIRFANHKLLMMENIGKLLSKSIITRAQTSGKDELLHAFAVPLLKQNCKLPWIKSVIT